MPVNETTTSRGYQKPHPTNTLANDVQRLRTALDAIDADVAARPTSAEVTTAINNAIAALINNAPEALNTLDELAAALGDDANFAASVTNQLTNRYTKAESDARYVQGATQTEMVFTAATSQTAFTLSTPVINKASALVTVDGIIQPGAEYSLSQDGVTLTLSEAPGQGAIVRVLALGVATNGAPADDTITTPKLRDGAVTTPKLGDSAVTTPKLGDGAVTSDKLGSNLTLSGITTVGPIVEQATLIAAAPSATQAYALSGKSVVYHTANATANFTANFTGLSALAVGNSATFAVLVTNGATPYYITTIQVDGTTSGVTTRWQGGITPNGGNANSIDSYSVTIIKTGVSAYTVMAAQTRF